MLLDGKEFMNSNLQTQTNLENKPLNKKLFESLRKKHNVFKIKLNFYWFNAFV